MTYVILVNWNGWRDTLECLESLFISDSAEYKVVVCDNGSSDDSIDRIQGWAEGKVIAECARAEMCGFSSPPCPKPVEYTLLKRKQIEGRWPPIDTPLVVIDCEENLGFAGGNNVGIALAEADERMGFVWLLNNDTVVAKDTLNTLIKKINSRSDYGMVGSTVCYYHQPEKVQAFGGARFFPLIGLSMHVGRFFNKRRQVVEQKVERGFDYIMGASIFVSRQLLETVGKMSEEYFLYYEELDWALRARKQFRLAYAQDSVIYHKAGASIGSSNKAKSRSIISDFYLMSNRLKITDKFYPYFSPGVKFFLLVEAVLRLINGQRKQARMIWDLVRNRLMHVEDYAKSTDQAL